MSVIKQTGLLAAGCQPWFNDVCAASEGRFAYCATLAIYIYQLDAEFNEYRLYSIMSDHKKTITSICWSPHDPDLLVSAGADKKVVVWNVADQKAVSQLDLTASPAHSVRWCPHQSDCVSFVLGRGMYLWNFKDPKAGVVPYKDIQGFQSDVSQVRWHPSQQSKIAFGHEDGSLSLSCVGQKPKKHVLHPGEDDGDDDEDPVCALEWDPLSTDYLLVSNLHQGVRLIDTSSLTVLNKFQLPSAAAQVRTLSWIPTAPGMFITGDTRTGIMRIWTVSKSTPIESLRVKKTGFHVLHVLETSSKTAEKSASSSNKAPVSTPTTQYALPSAHVVSTFMDGGVGLYDLGRRKWIFLRDMGHIETIFDCDFKPDNPSLLATASFDGTIKVWDVDTLTAVNSSPGQEGIIYSISWAPAGLNHIAASTAKNGVFIWDLTAGKIITRFLEHGQNSVYSVAWNQKDSRRLASCGADGFCVVREIDGNLLMRYKHPGAVYGCDWNPNNKDMIATGCGDQKVRVFYLATTNDKPLRVFSGHTAKVFNVRWSPLRDGILCSGSDDCMIRIWDYTSDACISSLRGHSGPVRGLLWNSEIPYLLMSGSWDYTIRVWDTRDGACIDTVLDHGADVYGLTSHPQQPFAMASCSRDSTVRTWSLLPLVQPLDVNLLAGRRLTDIVSNSEHAMSHGVPPLLTGRGSKDLKVLLERPGQPEKPYDTLVQFSKFFATGGGRYNLWELVSVIQGMDDNFLSDRYRQGIVHHKHITRFKAAAAQELEMAQGAGFSAGLGAPSREDRLREAANMHIRLGNVQKYCQLQVELGQWDKALALAPAVSMQYWKSLATSYADRLISESDDAAVPVCVATGDAGKLVKYLASQRNLQDAMLAAAAAHDGNMPRPSSGRKKSSALTENGLSEDESLLSETGRELADWYFHSGQPILAACCHLAVDDLRGSMCKLIRGNELELAASVGMTLKSVPGETDTALQYLARRCERLGQWDLAVDLVKRTTEPAKLLVQTCARCAGSMPDVDSLHAKAGLPSMENCLEKAESLEKSDLWRSIELYLLSTHPERGLELGLSDLRDTLARGQWKVDDLFDHLQTLASIQTDKLQKNGVNKLRTELMILCAYIGGLQAVRMEYSSIVPALFKHARTLLLKEQISMPLSESLLISEFEAWQTHHAITVAQSRPWLKKSPPSMTSQQRKTLEALQWKLDAKDSVIDPGPDFVMGSQLASHSDVHCSYLTGQRIQGASFFLEDGKSVVSVNEALMWAKVNPFSPLGSGCRINPF